MLFQMVKEMSKKLLVKWEPLLRPIPMIVSFALFILAGLFNQDHYSKGRAGPMMRAGNLAELKSYIESNSGSIELKNVLDMTPLMEAAYDGNEEAVRLLLKMGANIKATGSGQNNALHCAAVNGNVNVANLLIDSKVEVNARSNKGETPLDIAQRNRHELFVNYLRAYGGKSSGELSVTPAP